MPPTEITPIPKEQIEAYKMNWRGVNNGVRTPDQLLLDDLTATFMLSPFGRPGVNSVENYLFCDDTSSSRPKVGLSRRITA